MRLLKDSEFSVHKLKLMEKQLDDVWVTYLV